MKRLIVKGLGWMFGAKCHRLWSDFMSRNDGFFDNQIAPRKIGSIEFFLENEVAKIFGVTVRTVRNWASSGKIESSKVGNRRLFLKGDVENLILNRKF